MDLGGVFFIIVVVIGLLLHFIACIVLSLRFVFYIAGNCLVRFVKQVREGEQNGKC